MMEEEILDSHCHLWRMSRGDYDWLTPETAALAPIYRDFEPRDLHEAARGLGIGSHILVQAAATTAETRFLIGLAARDLAFAGVVGWVDLGAPGAAAEIEDLAQDPLLLGLRPMLQDLPDPNWINEAPRPEALAAMKRAGLRFDALITPAQILQFCEFGEKHPDLPIVVDHAAKPPLDAPKDDPRHKLWREGLTRLAALPHVSCKFSGLLTQLPAAEAAHAESAVEALRPTAEFLFEAFGPARLLWGSDWPVLTLAAPYALWAEVSERLLAPLDAAARRAILRESAQSFYLPEFPA